MSLLLLNRRAGKPYYYDKLNIGIWSGEELCYVIVNYPLLALSGFVTEGLLDWMDTGLSMAGLAARLREEKRAGESEENLLLEILQVINYYSVAEIRAYRNVILEYRKWPKQKLYRETGKMFAAAGRYHFAEEKFEAALSETEILLKEEKEEGKKQELSEEKAEILCDLVAVSMLRFDTVGALRFLSMAEETERVERTREYRYLITGEADLSEEEKKALDERKQAYLKEACESEKCRRIRELSGLDSVKFAAEARDIVREWKKEYRKSS